VPVLANIPDAFATYIALATLPGMCIGQWAIKAFVRPRYGRSSRHWALRRRLGPARQDAGAEERQAISPRTHFEAS